MRVNGVNVDSQTPSMGLRQGCPLIASLFSLFIHGLHHYLETPVPTAGIRIFQMRLRELVYADDICLLASSPEQLQALIDALAVYCATSRMEISEPKTKVMVVSAVPAPAVYFTCNGNTVEQVATYEYLGLHFHQSGSIVHLVTPIKARARTICRLLPFTPHRRLLTEVGLLPLQVFCFGGAQLCNFGMVWLFFLLIPSTTLSVWTTLLMPFRGVLAICLAHWQHV